MLYPLFLKLSNKRCLVVGGGKVAERKVLSLLKSNALVTVNSPDLTPSLQNLADEKKIEYISSTFSDDLLDKCFLVIASTDDEEVNKRVAREAEKRDILYNVVDVPEKCNFYVPSLVERGDLSIAISTNGKSPALAKKLRKKLEGEFGEGYSGFLELMGRLRERVLQSSLNPKERSRLFEFLVDSDLLDMFCQGKDKEAEMKADEIAGKWIREKGG